MGGLEVSTYFENRFAGTFTFTWRQREILNLARGFRCLSVFFFGGHSNIVKRLTGKT